MVLVPLASAARMYQRLVSDLEPGMRTVCVNGEALDGAFHNSVTSYSLMAGRLDFVCGRYALKADPMKLVDQFDVTAVTAIDEGTPELLGDMNNGARDVAKVRELLIEPRFNMAPTNFIPGIVELDGVRTLTRFSWGLVPKWAKDPAIGSRMINARVETVEEKPSFRSAITKRRCVIPMDGWYEWETLGPRSKVPHFFSAVDGSVLAVAGIYETWTRPDGLTLYSCAILTTEARDQFASIHDRMPVLLTSDSIDTWLAPGPVNLDEILAQAAQVTPLQEWAVASAVGNVRNDNATLIEPEIALF